MMYIVALLIALAACSAPSALPAPDAVSDTGADAVLDTADVSDGTVVADAYDAIVCGDGFIATLTSCYCQPGRAVCRGECVDPLQDNRHCGACDSSCRSAERCMNGVCSVPQDAASDTSDAAQDVLAADACVSFTVGNCCGVSCRVPGHAAIATCGVTGRCEFTCSPGYGDCDGDAGNGCETDLSASTPNCGACRSPCATGLVCANASCVCPNPRLRDNCDGNAANGCETDVTGDPANCGACGNRCRAPSTLCVGGMCR